MSVQRHRADVGAHIGDLDGFLDLLVVNGSHQPLVEIHRSQPRWECPELNSTT